MKIKSLKISNFRSFDENGIELNPHPQMNILVGENNVGKSNIFAALEMVKQCLYNRNSPPWPGVIDCHRGNANDPVTVKAVLTPSEQEARQLVSIFINGVSQVARTKTDAAEVYGMLRDTIDQELCKSLEIGVSYSAAEKEYKLPIKCGFLYLDGNTGFLQSSRPSSSIPLDWLSYLNAYADKRNSHGKLRLQDVIAQAKAPGQNVSVEFPREQSLSVEERVRDVIASKLKTFPDIRQRPPSGSGSSILESPDGNYLASVLLNLKDHPNMGIRDKYRRIKGEFEKLFPGLTFESVTGPNVHFKDLHAPPYEVPVQAVGMGIVETLNFITNIMGLREHVLLIDTPELHLHPHAQRLLAKIFHEYKSENQVFLITHSPYFVDPTNINCHHVVRLHNGCTEIKCIPESHFTEAEKYKLKQELLVPGSRELFFSRVVLLVEGPAELGAMPIFAEKLDKTLDEFGVTIHSVDGKESFPIYMTLLESFDIPYLIMADNDWDSSGVPSDNWFKLDSDFEGVLKEAGFGALLKKARREVGRSKVRQGIYVAEKIPKKKIPQTFITVIDRIIEKAHKAIGA